MDSVIVRGPYRNNCNRLVVVIQEKDTKKQHVKSYPRYLVEQQLGYPLDSKYDVHHIDGNPENNSLDNLKVVLHGEHQREHMIEKSPVYVSKIVVCPVCGKEFLWTAEMQKCYHHNRTKHKTNLVMCSRSCAGKLGRLEQLRRNSKTECE